MDCWAGAVLCFFWGFRCIAKRGWWEAKGIMHEVSKIMFTLYPGRAAYSWGMLCLFV
jgi:hypothetical protein